MWASCYENVFLLLMPSASFVSGKRLKKTPEKKTGKKGKSPDIRLGKSHSLSLSPSTPPLETANRKTCLGIHRL